MNLFTHRFSIVAAVITLTGLLLSCQVRADDDDDKHHGLPDIYCESDYGAPSNKDPNQPSVGCPTMTAYVATAAGHALNSYTYDHELIHLKESSEYSDFIVNSTTDGDISPRLGLCQAPCTTDSQCAPGLYCSAQHTGELLAMRYNPIKANCGRYRTGLSSDSVCFDPIILVKVNPRAKSNPRGQNRQRRQLCAGKCLTQCRNSQAPVCLALRCKQNCDRRRMLSDDDKEFENRRRQLFSETNTIEEMETLATNKLRDLVATADTPECVAFLRTAQCKAIFSKQDDDDDDGDD